jgi:hypothetical protein
LDDYKNAKDWYKFALGFDPLSEEAKNKYEKLNSSE